MKNSIQLAYLAGIIDGEGTVSAQTDNRNKNHLAIRISVANSNHDLINWLQITFGGSIYNRKTYKKHHKPQKEWRVTGLDAINLAKSTLEYSIIKKPQLELLVELELLRGFYQKGTPGKIVTPELVGKRIPIVDKIIELNRRNSSQWINRPGWRRLATSGNMVQYLRGFKNETNES